MGSTDSNFYKFIMRYFPYVVIGAVLSFVMNYIMMSIHFSWPFGIASFNGDNTTINFFGLVANFFTWIAIFSVTVPVLQIVFFKKSGF